MEDFVEASEAGSRQALKLLASVEEAHALPLNDEQELDIAKFAKNLHINVFANGLKDEGVVGFCLWEPLGTILEIDETLSSAARRRVMARLIGLLAYAVYEEKVSSAVRESLGYVIETATAHPPTHASEAYADAFAKELIFGFYWKY